MKSLLIATPLLLLAACMDGRPGGPPPPPRGECRAGPVQRFVGVLFRPAVTRQAQRVSGARTVRVIRPGQMVTMDFRQDRLNIDLNADNRVRALRCG